MGDRARRRGFGLGLGRTVKVGAELHGQLDLEPALRCASCDRVLGGDPEDEPNGDAGLPICGECNRERNFAAFEELGDLGDL